MKQKLVINLWFNDNAKEAVDFYLSVFKSGRIIGTDFYTDEGEEITGHKKGDVLTIEYELMGTRFVAINAGPNFTFNPSVSLSIACGSQEEIDYYWERLSFVPEAEACGWLQDKYGFSWQIVPKNLSTMLRKGTQAQRNALTKAFLAMKKFDLRKLSEAYRGA